MTDILDQATRALRSKGHGPSQARNDDDIMVGLSSVLRDVRRHQRRRRVAGLVMVQLGAIFIGFTAWAAASGRLVPWVDALIPGPAETKVGDPAPSGPTHRPQTKQEVIANDPAVIATPPSIEPPPVSSRANEPESQPADVEGKNAIAIRPGVERGRRHMAPKIEAMGLPPEGDLQTGSTPSPLEVYRHAHVAHFERRDWDAAVGLWDDYLATGDHQFVIEARFNRAIALVRVGRKQEAASALRPFAEGDYGTYRRDEARRLLLWLGDAESSAPP